MECQNGCLHLPDLQGITYNPCNICEAGELEVNNGEVEMSRANHTRIIPANKLVFWSLCFMMIALAGCAGVDSNSAPVSASVSEEKAEPVEEVDRTYYLQPGDVIDVKFYYNPALNESVSIRPDGKISLQLIGELTAAEIKPSELNEIIIEKYRKFLNPF